MFRAHSTHRQKVHDPNCTNSASGIVTLCKCLCLVHPLRKSFLSGCTRQTLADSDDTRGFICTIWAVDLLMMGGMRSKHIGKFN